MSMMTPRRSSAPFFLGGSQILVSYPTNTMMRRAAAGMRGNNIPFSHAVAFHEMIPGHNLVGYGARATAPTARGSVAARRFSAAGLAGLTLYDMGFHDARGARRGAFLAHASLRSHHLLAQLPHGHLVAAGGHRFPGRQGRARTRQRDRRGAPVVPGRAARSIRRRICSAGCGAGCARSWSSRGR